MSFPLVALSLAIAREPSSSALQPVKATTTPDVIGPAYVTCSRFKCSPPSVLLWDPSIKTGFCPAIEPSRCIGYKLLVVNHSFRPLRSTTHERVFTGRDCPLHREAVSERIMGTCVISSRAYTCTLGSGYVCSHFF